MTEKLTVQMDVMNTTRNVAVIKIDPAYADVLFDSLMRAQGLCRGRRDRVQDAENLEKLAGAIAGAADFSTRMSEV